LWCFLAALEDFNFAALFLVDEEAPFFFDDFTAW
jgi:hypothetical protein